MLDAISRTGQKKKKTVLKGFLSKENVLTLTNDFGKSFVKDCNDSWLITGLQVLFIAPIVSLELCYLASVLKIKLVCF